MKDLIETFCKINKIKLNQYDDNKNNYYMFVHLLWQNIILTKQNDDEIQKSLEQKVNFDTSSNFIKNSAKEIVYFYETFTRNKYIKYIEKELNNKDNDLDKEQKENLEKELKNKYKTNNIISKDIGFNDKESCSLILLMNIIEENGVCLGVLKEGVFFDGKYSDLRIFLINNFNVTDIWSVDAKSFENTTTKTSIIKFIKTGKTVYINFWDIIVEKHEKNKIHWLGYGSHVDSL